MTKNKEKTEPKAPDKKTIKTIAKLEEQLEKITAEKQEIFEKLQRLSADYANFQKRVPRQISDRVDYEKKTIIRSLLPSLDNFDHALTTSQKAESLKSVIDGVKLTYEHMLDTLANHGVKRIDAAVGKEFDPAVHEALMQRSEEDKPENVVLEEFQKGYLINGQVLRPSKVVVNKKVVAEEPANEQSDDQADQTAEQTESEPDADSKQGQSEEK